jgi:signal transduction histidine kinase/ligand-binding sensor domain-containing protein
MLPVRQCLAWLLVLASSAPLLAADRTPTAEPVFASRTYRAEDGLPINLIYALAQDRDGYLWIGGPGGLVRFDGMQFVAWGANGEPPLPFEEVRTLLADRDGGLWLGFTEPGVVSRIVGNRLTTYRTQSGLPNGTLYPRAKDRSGAVWAVGPAGIATFHAGKWEQRQGRDGLPAGAAQDVLEDRSGTLWISTPSGIFRRAAGQQQFELADPTPASKMAIDPRGQLWLADEQEGLRRLGQPSFSDPHLARTPLYGQYLISDRRGHLWAGSPIRTGLLHVSFDSLLQPVVRPLSDERGIFNKLALAILEDTEGNIWVGTSGGLLRFYEPKGRTYSRADGLPDDNVRAIEATSRGDLWLGTAAGLVRRTAQGIVEPPRIPGLVGRAVTSLHTDRAGRLLIGFADSGLGMLENDRFLPIQTPGNVLRDNITTVRPDRRGGIWVCNLRDLSLYYWPPGKSNFRLVEGLLPHGRGSCSATLVDKRGHVWIGFDDGTLMVHEGSGAPRLVVGEGAPHGRVCAMHEDKDESIWIATTLGLGRYSKGKFSTVSARNGLPTDYFTAVIEDDRGDLWIGSNSGLIRLTKQQFERAAGDRSYRIQYTLYDRADGVSDMPVCYGEPHAVRDSEGRLWFASLGGAVIVDPVRFLQASAPLSPRIERVVADGVVMPSGRTSLPPRTSRVELNYSAVSMSSASKVRFQYRLEGFETAWVDAGTRRQAFYTNLGPGRYRFQVRASLNDTLGQAAVYDVEVLPAFYQTGTFYVMIAAIGAMLLWGVWQLRIRALHRRYALIMDERTRIGREIHDTVLQSMAGVALEIEGVARKAESPGAGVRDALVRISSEIKEHIAEVRHTILELRTSDEGAADLEEALREAGDQIVAGTPIRFELDVIGTPQRACTREVSRELQRIAREALRNAVRHAGATSIRAELQYTDDALHLIIRDNGSGFNVEERLAAESHHWGLLGMRERASRIGAQFDIRSRHGAGTAVETIVSYARVL